MIHLSSLYIDDEMTLDEKQAFITAIRQDEQVYLMTRDLIEQEQAIRAHLTSAVRLKDSRGVKPFGIALACSLLALLAYFFYPAPTHRPVPPALVASRFVIFQPEVHQVEIAGSFNGWKKVALTPIGDSGYWEVRLPLPSGEYRFAYILDGEKRIADPTIPGREQDDFGGVNSILRVGVPI